VIVAAAAVWLAGCGTSSKRGLSVAPASPKPASVLRFSFTAPDSTGRQGSTQESYTLSVSGPPRRGCVAIHADQLPAITKGQDVTVNVKPSSDGGRWCTGAFTARVVELARPVCAPGTVCPQFVRVVASVGEVRFKISG
jgi:hypothetical protein